MQGAPDPRALVKLLVEGFHSPCTACIRLVEWRDRKIYRNFDPHNQPSISLALRAPHVRGPE
jgi:hypothetical protein